MKIIEQNESNRPRLKRLISLFMFIFLVGSNTLNAQEKKALTEVEINDSSARSVESIFKIIEGVSNISFSYHKADIESSLAKIIDLSLIENKSAYSILIKISREEKLKFIRLNNTVNVVKDPEIVNGTILGEPYKVSGVVYDDMGETLPGATIQVLQTSGGTVTDLDGNFDLKVDGGEQILRVAFLGYENQDVLVSASNASLDIQLQAFTGSLGELVVVGYGKQKKESITGSIAKIDNETINQSKTANISNNLAGRVPGLVVNTRSGAPGQENIEILIRGKATTGDTSPLIVIDGVANRGGFERLNPEDIESISVLKDASAAIYGAQAANGVILVTTKRGYVGKPKFTYSNTFSVTQPAQRQELMNAPQYLTWIDEANQRNGRPQIYQNIIRDYQNGENNPNIWADVDWWEVAMDEWSPQNQHNVSLSGGNDVFQYFASGQLLHQDANFRGSMFGFNQNNLRSNIDVNATPNLKIGLDLAGRFEERVGSDFQSLIRGIYSMAPFESPYYENGLLRNTSRGNILPNIDGMNGGQESNRNVYNTKLTVSLNLDSLITGLSIEGWGAIDIINQTRRDFFKPYDIYFLNLDGEYENLRNNTGNIRLFQQTDEELSQTYHIRLNYNREFDNQSISGFIAYEQNQLRGEYLAASRMNLISEDLPYLFSGSEDNMFNDGRGWQSARVNYFGRFNYAYKNKYFVEATLRIDGSQNFSEDKRFGSFPGISMGWRINEEKFWKSDIVEELKLRVSWGKLGNDRVNDFQYLQLYNVGVGAVLGEEPFSTVGLTPGRTPNAAITWETAEKTNLGIDLSLKNGLLDVSLDAFYEQRSDILAQRNASVPLYAGIELPDENIGQTNNRGFELSLLHRGDLRNDFYYSVGAQYTYAINEIDFIDESPFIPEYQRVEGSPIDYLLVYQADGLYQNQQEIDESAHFPDAKPGDVRFVDVNEDGMITDEDRILLPYGPTPRSVFGFSFGAGWKGLQLNVFLQGQAGAKTIYRPWDLNMDSWYFENRWISEDLTPNAQSPATWDMSSSSIQNVSTIWVRDNNFLRIKNVELSYNVPKKITDRFKFGSMRVFVSGFNLGFIYNSVELFDPESRSDTGWYYPQQRVISTGLSATF